MSRFSVARQYKTLWATILFVCAAFLSKNLLACSSKRRDNSAASEKAQAGYFPVFIKILIDCRRYCVCPEMTVKES
jgi:hypothetical protein